MRLIRSFLRDETGATAIEYGLMTALISVALIGGASLFGNSLITVFGKAETAMATANR
jgi:pilus assembly protein Flp/PilA